MFKLVYTCRILYEAVQATKITPEETHYMHHFMLPTFKERKLTSEVLHQRGRQSNIDVINKP